MIHINQILDIKKSMENHLSTVVPNIFFYKLEFHLGPFISEA